LQLQRELLTDIDHDRELATELRGHAKSDKDKGEQNTNSGREMIAALNKLESRLLRMESIAPVQQKQLDAAKERRNRAWEALQ